MSLHVGQRGPGHISRVTGEAAAAALDADAVLWMDTALYPLTDAQKTLVSDLFVGLKADGNFASGDGVYMLIPGSIC